MEMGIFRLNWFLAGILTALLVHCNLPPTWFESIQSTSINHLKDAKLRRLSGFPARRKDLVIKASDIWNENGAIIMAIRRPGCHLCRKEALELNKLKLSPSNIPLVGVLHEVSGHNEFASDFFSNGELYLDVDKKFFGPKERRMFWSGLLRLSVYLRYFEAWRSGIVGNFIGDGTLLGGVFVVSPGGKDGILYEHRETFFGDFANVTSIIDAVKRINP